MKAAPLEQRFWKWVDIHGPIPEHRPDLGPCWVWIGHRFHGKQYGQITINHKAKKAHRVSWEIHFGKIPVGMCVCHKCDNPSCIRPDHLFLGTTQENTRDMINKGRKPSGKDSVKNRRSYKGSNHPGAILNEQKVLEILNRSESYSFLAKEYGVSKPLIASIKQRRSWTHVEIS
jgi:hypothetical protein